MQDRQFMGADGYVWWQGVVEDRLDPLQIGRCRVRILGYHNDDRGILPTEDLPWAYPAMPINSRPNGVPIGPQEGTWVMGFFRDGNDAQEPIITHMIDYGMTTSNKPEEGFQDPETNTDKPKRPYELNIGEINTNRLARGVTTDTVIESRNSSIDNIQLPGGSSQEEPKSLYDAKFPYNQVQESESGHIIELDDTPDKERINITHKDGNFIEMHPKGDQVLKVQGDNYIIVIKDNYLYVKGNLNISTDANLNEYIAGDSEKEVKGNDTLVVKGKQTETISRDKAVSVSGAYTETAIGNYSLKATNVNVKSTVDVTIKSGGKIKLN